MTTTAELIDRLRELHAAIEADKPTRFGKDIFGAAASRLSALQADNDRLKAAAEAERDLIAEDIRLHEANYHNVYNRDPDDTEGYHHDGFVDASRDAVRICLARAAIEQAD